MKLAEYVFDTRQDLASRLSARIAHVLMAAVKARGHASLVVSGGSTPRAMFEALHRHDLPWEHVSITLADERWVPPESEACNARLVRESLLRGPASRARFVPFVLGAQSLSAARDASELALRALPRPFDLVLLGLGDDCHTASLFPGAAELPSALDTSRAELCSVICPPEAAHARLSLTLRALLDSRRLIVLSVGADKWQAYQRAREKGPVELLPIRAVLQQEQVDVDVYWAS